MVGSEGMKPSSTLLCGLTALSTCLSGCNTGKIAADVGNAGKVVMLTQSPGPTLTQSTGDHLHSLNAVIDHDLRAFFHDLDVFHMTDRPTRLTPWRDR
jgi:hypothetical protein